MTKHSKLELARKLRRIKDYLDGLKIPSAIGSKSVVFEINGNQYRATSLYGAKQLVKVAQSR